MVSSNITILLADDDNVDCLLFKEALGELPVSANLTIVHNGEQVIEELTKNASNLPDVLFLDLNMPRKNGLSSLGEIKRNSELQHLPVIIFSTASEQEMVKNAFRNSAHYYICKPNNFTILKKVIYEALTHISGVNTSLPPKEKFMITGNSVIIPH